jgi:hypothetical protein
MRATEDREATMSAKLEPVYVPADDIDIYAVEEEGWYVMDEVDYRIIDGPFASRNECLKMIEAKAA